jgi:hypothetical protein
LPGNDGRKKQKDSHEEPESSKEIPLASIESLDVEVCRAQLLNQGIHSPTGIDPTEAQGVPDREKNEQDKSNAIK